MYSVSELLKDLSQGELRNLSMAKDGMGTLAVKDQPMTILYANDALKELYSKYLIKEKSLYISMLETITHYHLREQMAANYTPVDEEDDEPIRYIMDLSDEPFTGDVIKVLRVYSTTGDELPLNDLNDLYSVFTPEPLVLQVNDPVTDAIINVVYQAKHPILSGSSDEAIELPDVLHPALRAYVAFRVYAGMNTKDSRGAAADNLALYNRLCDIAREGDLVSTSTSTQNSRFSARGWR